MGEDFRLQNFLAKSGVSSRRGAAEIIKAGRVRVNGTQVYEPGFRVSGKEKISLDNNLLQLIQEKYYFALNKPVKYICSNSDERGRRTAISLIDDKFHPGLHNVGRLDYMSEGLILFTNDGDFTNKITHPSFGIEKEYLVETVDKINDDLLKKFQKGFIIQNEKYKIKSYRIINSCKVSLILTEGKNREIRKMFAAEEIRLRTLKRIRIGSINLDNLQSGEYRKLNSSEISELLKAGEK
jgi:23S rRNA pseudouridine2605 synthase